MGRGWDPGRNGETVGLKVFLVLQNFVEILQIFFRLQYYSIQFFKLFITNKILLTYNMLKFLTVFCTQLAIPTESKG
jgi:hypothetical protein